MIRIPVFIIFILHIHFFSFGQYAQSPCGELFYDSFEFSLDQWEQVGRKCQRTADFSSSGMYGIKLRDNAQLGSSISTIPLDFSNSRQLNVSFQFMTNGFEDSENFVLEVSIDGGKTFSLQENWIKGLDFENGYINEESVNIDLIFTENTIFRFRCNASSNDDQLFIDEVKISNCPHQGGMAFSTAKNNAVMDIVAVSSRRKAGALMLKSNPGREKFTIYMDLLQGKSGSVEIFNKMGAKLSRSIFKFDHTGELTFPIDYLENGNYSVCIKSSDDKLYVLRLIVGS